jgi:hypothetical protein
MPKSNTLSVLLLAAGSTLSFAWTQQLSVTVSESGDPVALFSVYELTLTHDASGYTNPFIDASVSAAFSSPNFGSHVVRGYYHSTNTWKIRFNPNSVGSWSCQFSMTSTLGSFAGSESFSVIDTGVGSGFLRQYSGGNYRFTRDRGSQFYPIGTQVLQWEAIPMAIGGDTAADIDIVGISDYISVMAGAQPWLNRQEFDGWPTVGPPGIGATSWIYNAQGQAGEVTGNWEGDRWGFRSLQGLAFNSQTAPLNYCMAASLVQRFDHTLKTATFYVGEPVDVSFWSATHMSTGTGTPGSPNDGFQFSVDVEFRVNGGSWQPGLTYTEASFSKYNWTYREFEFQSDQVGTWEIRWRIQDNSTVSNVAMPQSVQYFFVAVDALRIRPAARPPTGRGINMVRRMLRVPGEVSNTSGSQSPHHAAYDLDRCGILDGYFKELKQRDLSVILCVNDKLSNWPEHPFNSTNGGPVATAAQLYDIGNTAAVLAYKQYLSYLIARWGAYCDVWELFKEVSATSNGLSGAWFEEITSHIKSEDPYAHPITTTWDQPSQAWQDISTPHSYPTVSDVLLPSTVRSVANGGYAKPIVIDEFGNGGTLPNNTPVRLRTALWAALISNGSLVFWDTQDLLFSTSPWGGNSNAFLGEELRSYILILSDVAAGLPVDLAPISASVVGLVLSNSQHEAWGLVSKSQGSYCYYVHDRQDHTTQTYNDTITFDVTPGAYTYKWTDPSTGAIVDSGSASGTRVTLVIPPITTDMFLELNTGIDLMPPVATEVLALNPSQVQVRFSEPISSYESLQKSNYAIADSSTISVPIQSCELGDDGRTVLLAVGGLNVDSYQIVITGIADMAVPRNISGSDDYEFQYTGLKTITVEPGGIYDASIAPAAMCVGNTGGSATLRAGAGGDRFLLQFDLPPELNPQSFRSAVLLLHCFDSYESSPVSQFIYAHRVMKPWAEGAQAWGGGAADGVTWRASQVVPQGGGSCQEVLWANLGGDFIPTPFASALVTGTDAWYTLDIAPFVNEWLEYLWASDVSINHGLLIGADNIPYTGKIFYSTEYVGDPALRPRVIIQYE